MATDLKIPISDADICKLHVGDVVNLSGVMVTGRDAVHKWLADCFIYHTQPATDEDQKVYTAICPLLERGVIYHCGPVVGGLDTQQYRFVAAGPTTSTREEPYQGDILRHFNMHGVVGKGGMGAKTLKACQEVPAVYFHAIGGAALLIAKSVKKVLGVYKMEFGVPEAIWMIEVENLPVVVTMDSHGVSLHDTVREHSRIKLEQLLA